MDYSLLLLPVVDSVCSWHVTVVLQILSCGKQLQVWGGQGGATTYYDMIARDKEIVKVVLLLTGSIEGTKESVLEYISSFDKYKFLWQKDLATEYAAFMSTSPSLEVRKPLAEGVSSGSNMTHLSLRSWQQSSLCKMHLLPMLVALSALDTVQSMPHT